MLVSGLGDLLIFPCNRKKKPLIDAWPANAKRCEPPDHWPIVGAITGPRNGYDVLDVEGLGLAWLQANPLPLTRRHSTPRGFHFLFRAVVGLTGSNDLRIGKDIHVRATGSYHCWWPRQGYEVIDAPLADWPEGLLKLARGGDHIITSPSSSGQHIERAVLSGRDASETIGKLDPTAYREYDKWLRLMMACHSAGIEREDFVAWSISDPLYSDAEDDIRKIWDALKIEGNANGRVSVATLFAALKKQPERCLPPVPKGRRKMSRADVDELNRFARWLAKQHNDVEGALYWTACRYGEWRMVFVISDQVLERMLLNAAWEAGLRNKVRVLRQIRNGMVRGAMDWIEREASITHIDRAVT
jgi:hypothetical protein